MKLKLTYQPEEQEAAEGVLAALLRLLPGAKIRRDKSKTPGLCVYVTIKGAKAVAAVGKALDKTAPLRYNGFKE